MALRAGVDVGGTFTDVVVLDEASGTIAHTKIPTDYDDPIAPIAAGLERLAPSGGIAALHHATTLSTNAVIQGRLPRGALLTTEGFRDVLDIGRIQRPVEGIYDFTVDTPQPLVPRRRRLEVRERVDARGAVVVPLDEADLGERLAALAAGPPVEAIAVCALFAFTNPEHERRIRVLVEAALPGVPVSISSEVSPEIREFERTSTVVLDALLKPIVGPYLGRLYQRMRGTGVDHTRVMMASGGLTDCDTAARMPVHTLNSGPAAGVLAAASLGRAIGVEDLVTVDMGGTSVDIGVVERGRPVHRYENAIAGYPVRVPAIDVAAVAAGGGSIARVDAVGYLQVDRESAGSVPGPACYRRGGERPTITDADLVLGRLGTRFGGGIRLDAGLARAALARGVADPLGVDVEAAAASVLDLIQARMVKAIATHTLHGGIDLTTLPLVAYGGAGPLHAAELAAALDMSRVVVPLLAGNFSAVGLLLCPLRWDVSAMIMRFASKLSAADLEARLAALAAEAFERIEAAGAEPADLGVGWLAHMRYDGQSYDLPVSLDEPWSGRLDDGVMTRLVERFHALHLRRYAYGNEREEVEVVQVRLTVSGPETPFPRPPAPGAGSAAPGRRRIYFTSERAWVDAAVHDRASLGRGATVVGPAAIEDAGASTLVPPGWQARVDDYLGLDLRR